VLTTHLDVGAGTSVRRPDELAVEEPLEIHLDGTVVSTTMRTPGHDFELAAGFCFTEGLLAGAPVQRCRYCAEGPASESGYNVVSVETGGQAPPPAPRLTTTSSSCGICGVRSVDDLVGHLQPLVAVDPVPVEVLVGAVPAVRERQVLFSSTGAVHAAAAVDVAGEVVVVREDVGRHNAVDKVVGHLLLDGRLPAVGFGLFVSGRASFEMVQKAWAAGFGSLLAVSAPTALAVETARRANLVLAGFLRGDEVNVYAPERIAV
jgi:FdhD protein